MKLPDVLRSPELFESLPGETALTAMLDMFQALDVDAVMLPEHLDEPKLMDRLQIGKTAPMMVQRIAELSWQRTADQTVDVWKLAATD